MQLKKLSDNIRFWITRLEPYAKSFGYLLYMDCLKEILDKGNSATRQRKVMKYFNDIRRVAESNVLEFEAGEPIWN